MFILTAKMWVNVTPCPLTEEIHLCGVEDLISNKQKTVFKSEVCEGH